MALALSLASGALTLGEREGIAWTEVSRGLRVRWIGLEPGGPEARHA